VSATLRFRIEAPAAEAERLVAALHEAGTLGVEERDLAAGRVVLLAWFSGAGSRPEILALADEARGVSVEGPEAEPDADWDQVWREGLAPRRVGPLWIRPSWCAAAGEPELVIDPERAFGSGEHASTRLALRLLLDALRPGDELLDVGTGSGLLALGALRCGAARAVGIDVDPVACACARSNAARNGLALPVACATLDALDAGSRFDVVVANLIRRRLEPWIPRIAGAARRAVVLSGLLPSDVESVLALAASSGLREADRASEEQTDDRWTALALHARSRQ
jgi:ribosomal protein L11 methyltransferase